MKFPIRFLQGLTALTLLVSLMPAAAFAAAPDVPETSEAAPAPEGSTPSQPESQAPIVEKAPEAVTGLLYNGEDHTLITAGTAQGGTMVYYAEKDGAAPAAEPVWKPELPQAVDAGTYTVHYKALSQDGESQPGKLSVTIAPRPVTITARVEKTYDGTTALPQKDGYDVLMDVQYPATGFLPRDQVQFLGTKGSRFQDAAAGNNKALIPGTASFSGEAQNYQVTLELLGSIAPKPVTVTLGASKHYGQKDPQVLYTAEGLLKGDSLSGSVTRQPGEEPGTYALKAQDLAHPSYEVTVKEGSLKILPGKAAISLDISRKSANPGSTVTLTVKVRNDSANLMDSGWQQPGKPYLTIGGRDLALKEKDGSWVVSFKVPQDAAKALTFTASLKDSRYAATEVSRQLEISKPGDNPPTGDARSPMVYMTVAAVSGLLLAGTLAGLYMEIRKSR